MGQKTRINKYMALCGVASRRKAEELICEGRVTLNGATLKELGTLVDHDKDKVSLDGLLIEPAKVLRYFLFYKPKEVLTSLGDPFDRKTISDYVDDIPERVFPVGRLDYDTTGVLLLTNDGELAHKLTHPRYQVRKIYEALAEGEFRPEISAQIARGIELEDGSIGKAESRLIRREGKNSLVELVLTEGHKREVKQLLGNCDLPVLRLHRREFAGLTLGSLKPGQKRPLTMSEIQRLKKIPRAGKGAS